MKKVLLFILLLMISVATMFGQSLNEDFEGATFPPTGWVERHLSYPSIKTYPMWSQTTPKDPYLKGYSTGGQCAMAQDNGFGTKVLSSFNWLITPQVTVGEGEYLSFMLGANAAYNGSTNATTQYRISVLVSTASNDSASFKDTIFTITPKNILNWGMHYIDMSKYAGKQIYIAFLDHGTRTGTAGAFLKDAYYLDNVKMTKNSVADLSISNLSGLINGCMNEQQLTATITNTGSKSGTFKICYQYDGNNVVREDVNSPIESNGTLDYKFNTKLIFKQPKASADSTYNIKVWVENPDETHIENDSTETSLKLSGSLEYPYIGVDTLMVNDFRSSNVVGSRRSYWKWSLVGTTNFWVYTAYSNYCMLASNCITLPKGKVRINFEYLTAKSINMDILLGHLYDYANYKKVATLESLSTTDGWAKAGIVIDVDSIGTYSVGLMPGNITSGQISIRNIQIIEPTDDAATINLLEPYANTALKDSAIAVTAIFRNQGKEDITNLPVHYQLNNKTAIDEVIPGIPAGETIKYSFVTKLVPDSTGTDTLKVWCSLKSDITSSNDTIKQVVEVYNPVSIPYKMGFEPSEYYKNWTVFNPDKDFVLWDFMQVVANNINYAKEGSHAAFANSISGVTHNDWLISPATKMPKGKVRLSFYYTTRYSTGNTNLKVFLSKTNNVDSLKNSKMLLNMPVTNVKYYQQGYALMDIPEDGNYYIGFYDEGLGRDIILDDVRIDQAEDLAIISAKINAQSGFALNNADVTISFVNRGTTAKTNIPVAYSLYAIENSKGKEVQNENATITETVQPGDTATYTFPTKAAISLPGNYMVIASVNDADDSDSYNNKIQSNAINNYEIENLPYKGGLETVLERGEWTLGNKWETGGNFTEANSAYEGTGAIRHTGAAAEQGDWAFSPCIHIPAGTYNLDFFYRTSMSNTASSNAQNFEIMLGKAANADSMTTSVYKASNVLVPNRPYQKVISTITIPEEGNYYIGVKCTTTATEGSALFMDNFAIHTPVTTGIDISDSAYTSDYEYKEGEWYHYNPGTYHFWQWEQNVREGKTCMKTLLPSVAEYASRKIAGIYESPAFSLRKGDNVKVTFTYAIEDSTAYQNDNKSIRLYMADKDLPESFTTLVAEGNDHSGKDMTATGTISIPADGIYYFGYQAVAQEPVQAFYLLSTRIEKMQVGLKDRNAENVYSLSGSTISLKNVSNDVAIYSENGQLMMHASGIDRIDLSTYTKGIYILSIMTEHGVQNYKFIIK